MTVAPAGIVTFAPMAAIVPFDNTIVPLAIGALVTGTMVALRMAITVLRPGLLRIVDCASALEAISRSATASVLRIRLVSLRCILGCVLRGVLLRGRGVVGFLLQALLFLLAELFAADEVLGAVEVDLALDEGRVDARVGRQRMAVPDREVRVLADFDRADARVEAELARR